MEINLFTIGFAKKSAKEFFDKLKQAGVEKVIDVRLNNVSQLAGFTKKIDLEYFLSEITKIEYVHKPGLAPTKAILDAYRKKQISWTEYEEQFCKLMTDRNIESFLEPEQFDKACLLCSESKPVKCHRRLIAEYLKTHWSNIVIQHL